MRAPHTASSNEAPNNEQYQSDEGGKHDAEHDERGSAVMRRRDRNEGCAAKRTEQQGFVYPLATPWAAACRH